MVVEDDPNIADLLDMYLRQAGYRVIQATTGEAGLAAIERERPRMAILDIGLPGAMDGITGKDFVDRIKISNTVVPLPEGQWRFLTHEEISEI